MTDNSPNDQNGNGARRWVVVGASGFVGSAICAWLREHGQQVTELSAPRLTASPLESPADLARQALASSAASELAEKLRGNDVVVTAAGLARPDARETPRLTGANALLPAVVAVAAAQVGIRRHVHLSSAAVQGRGTLDETTMMRPFSAYSRSKALGERVLAELSIPGLASRVAPTVSIRATSVQGADRGTTKRLLGVAASRWSCVAGDGDRPTALVHVDNLAALVQWVGEYSEQVPAVVLQPCDGLTTGSAMQALGGREPHHLPVPLVKPLLVLGHGFSRLLGGVGSGGVRRAEVLLLGQAQLDGWAAATGFTPPVPGHQWAAQLHDAHHAATHHE